MADDAEPDLDQIKPITTTIKPTKPPKPTKPATTKPATTQPVTTTTKDSNDCTSAIAFIQFKSEICDEIENVNRVRAQHRDTPPFK